MGFPRHKFVLFPSIRHIIACRASRLSQQWPFIPDDRPDLEQSMRLHLIERSDRYDPERGTHEMFAESVLSNWEAQQHRNARRLKRRSGHYARPMHAAPHSELICRDWQHVERLHDANDLLDRCSQRLDDQDLLLLWLIVDHGEQGAAEILKTTRHQIRTRLGLIRDKCRNLKENDQKPDRP